MPLGAYHRRDFAGNVGYPREDVIMENSYIVIENSYIVIENSYEKEPLGMAFTGGPQPSGLQGVLWFE
ncbi:hypothetical protein J43TS9_51940 [Paenibacillus cineris]|nr:hypothetical protein J43TS9_51940 [Paenibacillus cineris]